MRSEENEASAVIGGGLERGGHRLARDAFALLDELDAGGVEERSCGVGHGAHHVVCGEEDEGASAGGCEEIAEKGGERLGVAEGIRGGVGEKVGGHHERLAEVVEGRGGHERLHAVGRDVGDAELAGHVVELVASAEGGGAEHDGVLHVEEALLHLVGDREGGGHEADVGAVARAASCVRFMRLNALGPEDVGGFRAGEDELGLEDEIGERLGEAADGRGKVAE